MTLTGWVIIKPDGDLHDEGLEQGDAGGCRLVPLDGSPPADGWGVFANTYRFRTELNDNTVNQNVVLGKQKSEAIVAAEGLPAPPPATSGTGATKAGGTGATEAPVSPPTRFRHNNLRQQPAFPVNNRLLPERTVDRTNRTGCRITKNSCPPRRWPGSRRW